MKIEVGEYVRTKTGKIDKVINPEFYIQRYIECERELIFKYDIVKHSKNITDLIEIGDIIHTKDVLNEDIVYIWSQEYLEAVKEDINNGIRLVSILTREQLKNAEYRIPEEK